MISATERFSNRVDNYVKYRPHYPNAVKIFLEEEKILLPESVVADTGSGTGISSELFLKNGNTVFGIEPNKEMRKAAETLLSDYPNFNSIEAVAEDTSLQNSSVDLIVAGQAFHWFDREKCRAEFKRILKPGGYILLMWNNRRTESTHFLIDYEKLLRQFGTDYSEVDHKNINSAILDSFYGTGNYKTKLFENLQHFDYEGLKGRLLSSSYVPVESSPDYQPMLNALKELFIRYHKNNLVTIEYDTIIYYGR